MNNTNRNFGRFHCPTIFANALAGRADHIAMLNSEKVISSGLDCPSRFYYSASQAGGGAWS